MWRLSWSDSKCGVMVFSRKLWISLFSFKSCQWWSQPDSYRSNAEDRRETRERELHIPPGLWISQYHQERVIRWCGCEASLPNVLLSGPHEVGNNPVWSWPALFSTGSHALACCGDPDNTALALWWQWNTTTPIPSNKNSNTWLKPASGRICLVKLIMWNLVFVKLNIFSSEYWRVYKVRQMVVVRNTALSDTADCTLDF